MCARRCWPDVIPPGTAAQVLVNGREIVNRPVWKEVQRFAIDQSGPLTITIKSSTFRSPNDPRDLGLALKSVTIEAEAQQSTASGFVFAPAPFSQK
jgi:hypothetical protein